MITINLQVGVLKQVEAEGSSPTTGLDMPVLDGILTCTNIVKL